MQRTPPAVATPPPGDLRSTGRRYRWPMGAGAVRAGDGGDQDVEEGDLAPQQLVPGAIDGTHSTRSTSGNSRTLPEPFGHSSSKVLLERGSRRGLPPVPTRSHACRRAGGAGRGTPPRPPAPGGRPPRRIPVGGGEGILARLVLAFGDRPGGGVLPRPEGSARVGDQDVDLTPEEIRYSRRPALVAPMGPVHPPIGRTPDGAPTAAPASARVARSGGRPRRAPGPRSVTAPC